MKKIVFVLLFIPLTALAGGRTDWAIPTQMDIERGNGFMVYGAFGNPAECSQSNRFYIKSDHPQYEKIYSTVLAAYTAKKKIRAYIHKCELVMWYSASATYNTLNASGDFQIKD